MPFENPYYSGKTGAGDTIRIDVTNSISAGLEGSSGLVDAVTNWMDERGLTTILDFGAGALRHTIPLLEAGFQVTAVEYREAFQRERAAQNQT